MNTPRNGSSHSTFRKLGCQSIIILKHDPIKKVYVEMFTQIVEDKDEGGYVLSYPDLPGCISCGQTVESAIANALFSKRTWIEAALEDGIEIREPDSLEDYSCQFKLRIPRSLQRLLVEHSKREGISMHQYCVYLFPNNTLYNKCR